MQKKAQATIFIIVAILIITTVIIVTVFVRDNSLEENFECKIDADCVKVQTTCCGCEMGGQELCVSRDKEDDYDLGYCTRAEYVCPAVYSCVIESCLCVEGSCVSS